MDNIRPWDEVCKMLPPLSTSEKRTLAASIEAEGVRMPIMVLPDGRIIDGHHRWELSGGKAPVKVLDISEERALSLAVALNIARRQLSPDQLREVRDNLRHNKELLKHTAIELRQQGMSQAQAAAVVGVDDTTISKWESKQFSDLKFQDAKIPDLRISVPKDRYGEIYERRQAGEPVSQIAADYKISSGRVSQIVGLLEQKQDNIEADRQATTDSVVGNPKLYAMDALEWLKTLPNESADLLITDPLYITEQPDLKEFTEAWLPLALKKVRLHGQAYIFTGAYPKEMQIYLNILLAQSRFEVANVMVWTYRNTIGPQPKDKYVQNWQAVFYLRGCAASPLNCESIVEQFSVQDVNAPDGRHGTRFYKWQKPDELAERLIRHSTSPEAFVIDPFAGSGTFLVAASKLGRYAFGSEISADARSIAVSRGCELVE